VCGQVPFTPAKELFEAEKEVFFDGCTELNFLFAPRHGRM